MSTQCANHAILVDTHRYSSILINTHRYSYLPAHHLLINTHRYSYLPAHHLPRFINLTNSAFLSQLQRLTSNDAVKDGVGPHLATSPLGRCTTHLAQQLFVYSSKLFLGPHVFFREHTSVIALHWTFITSPSSYCTLNMPFGST